MIYPHCLKMADPTGHPVRCVEGCTSKLSSDRIREASRPWFISSDQSHERSLFVTPCVERLENSDALTRVRQTLRHLPGLTEDVPSEPWIEAILAKRRHVARAHQQRNPGRS